MFIYLVTYRTGLFFRALYFALHFCALVLCSSTQYSIVTGVLGAALKGRKQANCGHVMVGVDNYTQLLGETGGSFSDWTFGPIKQTFGLFLVASRLCVYRKFR